MLGGILMHGKDACYSGSCGCGPSGSSYRSFLTKEEKIEMLKEYQDTLEKEAQGVKEKIKRIEEAN